MDCSPPGSPVHEILQARYQSGCHSLLQGSFPIQGLKPGLLHCTWSVIIWATREAWVDTGARQGPPLPQWPLLTSTQGRSSVHKVYSHMLSLLWDKEASDAHFAASKRKWATSDMSTFKLSPIFLQAAAASTCYRQRKILISELKDQLSQIFFFLSFSREFDWDVGIVPVPGDRDAQNGQFPPFLRTVSIHSASEPHSECHCPMRF